MLPRLSPLGCSILFLLLSKGPGLHASDCNGNGISDFLEIISGQREDCDGNQIPDECDIRNNGDCNQNGILDRCELFSETSPDCNFNGVPDECDLSSKQSADCNEDRIPDECQSDCNRNGLPDDCDLASGAAVDCNGNGIPDSCDLLPALAFSTIASFSAGDGPVFVAAGDLNIDGKPDLAVANPGSKDVSLLLNAGGEAFISPRSLELGSGPNAVEIGDFDGDLLLDLAASLPDSQAVAVLLNQGDGAFASPLTFSLDGEPAALTAADVDGDGDLDLAAAASGPDRAGLVSLLLNQGNGTFQRLAPLLAGLLPSSMATGDFNGDGAADLAIVDKGLPRNLGGTITVFLNRLQGNFDRRPQVLAPASSVFLVSADIDQDNDKDLLLISNGGASGAVWLIENDGAGNFQSSNNLAPGNLGGPSALAAGDWNGDRRIDLAVVNQGSDSLSILWNEGKAVFVQEDLVAGNGPGHVAAADLNGDGRLDLAITRKSSAQVTVIWNRGTGEFEGPRALETSHWVTGGAAADFDGDAAPDLALVNGEESPPSVFLNLGDGTFSLAQNIPSISTPDSLAPMDLNQDGRMDLVVGSQALSRLQLWLNLGVGGLEASGIIDLPVDPFSPRAIVGPLSLLPIDVDNDADVDLVVGDAAIDSLQILLNDGAGALELKKTLQLKREYNATIRLVSGDWDGDGLQDLALPSYASASLLVFWNEGLGSFRAEEISTSGEMFSPMATVDMDRDGKLDLVAALFPPSTGEPWAIASFLNEGGGKFAETSRAQVGFYPPETFTTGDLNSDGFPDLVFTSNRFVDFSHFLGAQLSIFFGRGKGGWEGPMKAFPSDSALFGAIARDWNGDGKPDLAVLTRTVHLLTNQSVALSKDLNQSVIPDECEASARLESLTFEPTRVSGGSSATATLTLASAAPAEGANVRLAGSAPELTRFPESIVVSGGETKVTFKIKTTPVEKAVAAVLTARKDHVERRAALTVLPPKFRRGDVDQDGSLNLTDAIDIFLYLFLGGDMPFCLDAADADDNGHLNLTDPVAILFYLFRGHAPLPDPFGECGWDAGEDSLGCRAFRPCSG